MKQDLIKLIKKYLDKKDIENINITDTPFGKYNNISYILYYPDKDKLFINKDNTIIETNNPFIEKYSEDFIIDLFLTIYDKIKETHK